MSLKKIINIYNSIYQSIQQGGEDTVKRVSKIDIELNHDPLSTSINKNLLKTERKKFIYGILWLIFIIIIIIGIILLWTIGCCYFKDKKLRTKEDRYNRIKEICTDIGSPYTDRDYLNTINNSYGNFQPNKCESLNEEMDRLRQEFNIKYVEILKKQMEDEGSQQLSSSRLLNSAVAAAITQPEYQLAEQKYIESSLSNCEPRTTEIGDYRGYCYAILSGGINELDKCTVNSSTPNDFCDPTCTVDSNTPFVGCINPESEQDNYKGMCPNWIEEGFFKDTTYNFLKSNDIACSTDTPVPFSVPPAVEQEEDLFARPIFNASEEGGQEWWDTVLNHPSLLPMCGSPSERELLQDMDTYSSGSALSLSKCNNINYFGPTGGGNILTLKQMMDACLNRRDIYGLTDTYTTRNIRENIWPDGEEDDCAFNVWHNDGLLSQIMYLDDDGNNTWIIRAFSGTSPLGADLYYHSPGSSGIAGVGDDGDMIEAHRLRLTDLPNAQSMPPRELADFILSTPTPLTEDQSKWYTIPDTD